MSFDIVLYRGDALEPIETLPLVLVVQRSLERILGRSLRDASIRLTLLEIPEEPGVDEVPFIWSFSPAFGYLTISVEEGDRVIYRHPHPVGELVSESLRPRLERDFPEERRWAFSLVGPGLDPAMRPTPPVEGAVAVQPYRDGECPPFRIQRVPDESLPEAGLTDFVREPGVNRDAFVKVLLHEAVLRELQETLPFSLEIEEGGFLLGRVYEDRDAPGTHLVEVTGVRPAEHTGASLLHLTFTGDSFNAVKRALRESGRGERLLGWYHSHLFPASETMGLSSVDLRLHYTTFRLPWQVAGLLNIDHHRRVLRFYVRQKDSMVACPQWVIDERR